MGKYDKLFEKKQESIKKISETKELGMEFANALNNAVAVWTVFKTCPLKLDPMEELSDIMDLVDFFRGMKKEVKEEMTAERAVEETKKVFEGSEKVEKPDSGTPQTPPPREELLTEPQGRMIHGILARLKISDHASKNQKVCAILGFRAVFPIEALSKRQANTAIKILLDEEQRTKQQAGVPF